MNVCDFPHESLIDCAVYVVNHISVANYYEKCVSAGFPLEEQSNNFHECPLIGKMLG
jgi:hypothetical protein